MNRLLKILAVLLLGTCLVSAVLACTILRPRTEMVSIQVVDGRLRDIPLHSRIQVTHNWHLSPLWEWRFDRGGIAACGGYGQTLTDGWQYGPFSFVERRTRKSWPVAIEKAAHAIAVRKLGVKEPELDIQQKTSDSAPELRWHVVARALGGKCLAMDFTEDGKILPASARK